MQEELEYLYALERFGIKPGLAVMEQLMELLDHPEKKFQSIHVTGTNGKGSTCAMIESVLRQSGKRTALYTSPHLHRFNERIKIAGEEISDAVLVGLISEIRTVVEKNNMQPTFFEFTTALAFLYFSQSAVDIAIIEVGMGGRYDATNVITPLVSVITNIGLDHMEFLGNTVQEIAVEKAGIIKEGVPAITSETNTELLALFDAEAEQKHTKVIRAYDVVATKLVSSSFTGQVVEVVIHDIPTIFNLPLLGAHQIQNMETAIAAITTLNMNLERGAVVSGIANTIWEGRIQVVSQNPLIIVDGAHNKDSMSMLEEFLRSIHRYDVLVVAGKKGKNIVRIMSEIILLFNHVIVTEGEYMPEDSQKIASEIRKKHKNIQVHVDAQVDEAMKHALEILPHNGTLLVTGSLYMIPQALAFLKQTILDFE